MKHSKPSLLALGSIALLLSGCVDTTLDYRNAQVSNGKIYNAHDNAPFTGRVTNIPNSSVTIPTDLQMIFAGFNKTMDSHNAKEQTFYFRELVCSSEVKDGFLSGVTTCFKPGTEIKRYQLQYTHGALNGPAEIFPMDGSKALVEGNFADNKLDGELRFYGPNNGRLVERNFSSKSLSNSVHEQWDEASGTLTYRAKAIDGQYVGLQETWRADGVKRTEVPYENGMMNGVARVWDKDTGKLIVEKTYVDNVMEGPAKEWSSNVTLVSSGTYKRNAFYPDSEPASPTVVSLTSKPSSPVPVECIDLWIHALYAEKGENALIDSAQLAEWNGWCDSGKKP